MATMKRIKEARMTSIRNMWIVIAGCFLAVFVDSLYSFWLFFYSNEYCRVSYIS